MCVIISENNHFPILPSKSNGYEYQLSLLIGSSPLVKEDRS